MSIARNMGIHARVLTAAVLIICASTFTLGNFGVGIIKQFVTLRFSQRIDFMTEYLAKNAELGILIDEQKLLQGLARSMLDERDVAGVEIENAKKVILVNEARDIPGPYMTTQKTVILSQTQEDSLGFDLVGGSISNGYIGIVRVKYSTKGIDDLVDAMKQRFVLIAFGLTIISCLIFYFISRSIVLPIISLAETARKVSMGNRAIRAASGNSPEAQELAIAFNEMLDSLAKGRKTLIQAYEKMARQETLAEVGKFSMMIAHEVKNPLGIIKSSLEILKKDLEIAESNIALTYAEEEIKSLNELIESFLMFSKPTKLNFSLIDLNKLVEQAVLGFEIQLDSEDMKIKSVIPEEPFYAEADFDLLSRGINNIIKKNRWSIPN